MASAYSELRVVMVGKTGSGKSATGNTILGNRSAFHSEAGGSSVTVNCSKESNNVAGQMITVVDTPGLYDTRVSNAKVIDETVKCLQLTTPGPHVVLLVIAVGRYTEEEANTARIVQDMFGHEVHRYMIVLFTRGDDLEYEKKTVQQFMNKAGPGLNNMVRACGGRYHVFNNRTNNRAQVNALQAKIQEMLRQNGNSCFSSAMFQMAQTLKKTKQENDADVKRLRQQIQVLQEINSMFCSIL